MKNESISNIISSLSKEYFQRFIYELWKVDNVDSDTDYVKLHKRETLGKGVLEQHWINWEDPADSKSFQGSDLIVPFFVPVDLLLPSTDFSLVLNKESTIVKRFHRIIEKRAKEWYWPQDGQFVRSKLYFVSNFCGIDKELYFQKILPNLERLVEPYHYYSEVGIGTCDSFLDMVPEKTQTVLKSLLHGSYNQTSFSWQDGKIIVSTDFSSSYLKSGVLPLTRAACDTVIKASVPSKLNILQEFEDLLNRRYTESALEKFIATYYKDIFGSHYDRIETQLWLKFPELDIVGKERRLDIFLRNAVQRDWELIELKKEGKLTSTFGDIPTLSSRLVKALGQLRNYENILQQDSVKKKMEQQGIEYYQPELRLVIGGNPEIPIHQWRRIIKQNEHGLKITTCRELLDEMKLRYNDMIDIFQND